MTAVLEVISSVEFWKFALPLLGAVIAWYTNEWRKRVADQYQRKEANYKELIRALQGFYEGAPKSNELKVEFLNQLNISWLYCPDEVILKAYAFLESVHARERLPDSEKQLAFGAFVAAVRKDLLSRKLVHTTELTAKDLRHYVVNEQKRP